jgi:hypothetical protein
MNNLELTDEEKNEMIKAMRDIDFKECRCKAINKKVNLAGIRKLSEIRNISLYKAKKIYDETGQDFHSCCAMCCSCHIERFSEDLRFY